MKNKTTLLNMLSGLLLQLMTILSGFVIPRIILLYFGSNANGLVASLNQLLSYISLAEGGVIGVVIANIYKPLVNRNNEQLSSVLVTADHFFKKIALFFLAYSLGLSVIYPLVIDTGYSFFFVFSLSIILASVLFIQYMFSLSYCVLLNADKKSYILNFVQTTLLLINIILAVIVMKLYPSIRVLKLITALLYVIQPITFHYYIRHHYSINWNVARDNSLIQERWDGFAINISNFIHVSTDVVVLTIFTTLKTVSVYSVYHAVSNGLKELIKACLNGVSHTIGQAYAKNNLEEVNEKLNLYEFLTFILVFVLFTVGALLITPFVKLYTTGITDIDYSHPVFGILLLLSEVLYLIKLPHVDLAYAANQFKRISIPSYIEAGLNIIISILLVHKYGLIGVAIGTIVGMTYSLVFYVSFTSTLLPGRKQSTFYKKVFLFCMVSVTVYFGCQYLFPFYEITVWSWLIHGIIYSLTVALIYLVISILFFKKELQYLIQYIKH